VEVFRGLVAMRRVLDLDCRAPLAKETSEGDLQGPSYGPQAGRVHGERAQTVQDCWRGTHYFLLKVWCLVVQTAKKAEAEMRGDHPPQEGRRSQDWRKDGAPG
jgi:hypothetical protein